MVSRVIDHAAKGAEAGVREVPGSSFPGVLEPVGKQSDGHPPFLAAHGFHGEGGEFAVEVPEALEDGSGCNQGSYPGGVQPANEVASEGLRRVLKVAQCLQKEGAGSIWSHGGLPKAIALGPRVANHKVRLIFRRLDGSRTGLFGTADK